MRKRMAPAFLFITLIVLLLPTNAFAQSVHGSCGDDAISSAVGCIPIGSVADMAGFFISWGVGIAAGVAFLSLIYAGFMLITSSGDPKKTQAARELVISSVSGIIFLVFAVYILRLVGVDILAIPGFGT